MSSWLLTASSVPHTVLLYYAQVTGNGLTLRNKTLSLYPAYAVWMSFSLSDSVSLSNLPLTYSLTLCLQSEHKNTDMSENRFQDNEVMSLSPPPSL